MISRIVARYSCFAVCWLILIKPVDIPPTLIVPWPMISMYRLGTFRNSYTVALSHCDHTISLLTWALSAFAICDGET